MDSYKIFSERKFNIIHLKKNKRVNKQDINQYLKKKKYKKYIDSTIDYKYYYYTK